MRVAGIDSNGDWRFGKGRSVYKVDSAAIRQNVLTRLRSYVGDWFADASHGEDWLGILGRKGNEEELLDAIERVTLRTEGVRAVERLEVISRTGRHVSIALKFIDLFDAVFEEEVTFQ